MRLNQCAKTNNKTKKRLKSCFVLCVCVYNFPLPGRLPQTLCVGGSQAGCSWLVLAVPSCSCNLVSQLFSPKHFNYHVAIHLSTVTGKPWTWLDGVWEGLTPQLVNLTQRSLTIIFHTCLKSIDFSLKCTELFKGSQHSICVQPFI